MFQAHCIMFMDGECGCPMKSLETDCSLGKTDVHPAGIESALQVLILFSEKILRKKKETAMVQTGAGWECGSKEHQRKDCPKCGAKKAKKDMDDDDMVSASSV